MQSYIRDFMVIIFRLYQSLNLPIISKYEIAIPKYCNNIKKRQDHFPH